MTTASFDPGPLARTECVAADDGWTLVFVRELHHPPATVWTALTDPEELAGWAPYTADRDLGTPGDVVLRMVDGEAVEEFAAEITRAEPPAVLEYTWGDDHLRWELEPSASGGGTTLTLRHTVKDPDWIPKVAAGWHICLEVADRRLAGEQVGPITGAAAMDHGWQKLHDAYAAHLGIESTGWPDA